MKWKKLGHNYRPDGTILWQQHSALTPTPIVLDADTVRVYAGFRDEGGVSRIGYVDLQADNPLHIKRVSLRPVLDIGRAGCFDDNGVILGDVVSIGNVLRMYYIGFQQVKNVKFLAFTGVAESVDNGETFQRLSEIPVMDRAPSASMIRAIHSVHYEQGRWKIWYAAGDDWSFINKTPYPNYTIWYTESDDGLVFSQQGIRCIDVKDNEYRIGRPSVYKNNGQYYMFYTKGTLAGTDYFPGLAVSNDGIHWERCDAELGLALSDNGFDSIHLCYPRLFHVNDRTYAVYNGNNMGIDGFGLAELLEW